MSTATLLSIEDFVQLGEANERFELVDGQLVEKPMGTLRHDFTRDEALVSMKLYLRQSGAGIVFLEREVQTLQGQVRRPDVCFFRSSRLTAEDFEMAVFPYPDLVIEVASENDMARDLRAKIHEYLDSGTEVVFVLYPDTREAENWQRGRALNPMGCSVIEAACVPGMSIPIEPLFDFPLPSPNDQAR